jgi:hypothetical protein
MIEKYSSKSIDDKRLISIKSNLIYWFEYWLFDALQLTSIEIYLYSTIYEMNNFDVELDSYLSRSHAVKWISRNETLRESFSRTFVLRSLAHFVIRSLRIWAWSLNRWVRLTEDLAETIEQALLDLRGAMRWLGVTYPYSGRGRNSREKNKTKELDTVSNLDRSLCTKKSSIRYTCSKTESRCFSLKCLKVSLSVEQRFQHIFNVISRDHFFDFLRFRRT